MVPVIQYKFAYLVSDDRNIWLNWTALSVKDYSIFYLLQAHSSLLQVYKNISNRRGFVFLWPIMAFKEKAQTRVRKDQPPVIYSSTIFQGSDLLHQLATAHFNCLQTFCKKQKKKGPSSQLILLFLLSCQLTLV